MRTTIDLPDDLVRAARVRAASSEQRAASSDESLQELFTRALTRELGRGTRKQRRELPVVGSSRPGRFSITPAELKQVLSDDDIERDVV